MCTDTDPELWFGEDQSMLRNAHRICASCPVQIECLRAALAHERDSGITRRWGVYGGLSPSDRAEIEQGSARHGTRLGFRMHQVRGEEPCEACRRHRRRRRKRAA
jgi:hypothetical protein